MSSSFGQQFRVTTWGESHGPSVGVVVDGCPPRIPIDIDFIQAELDRRRPGQSKIVTQRKESDQIQILSGVYDGLSLGTPIAMVVFNEDARPGDYEEMKTKFRPSHADFAYVEKFGIRAPTGGGRSSARETIGRVAAGAIAKIVLRDKWGVEIVAYVESVKDIKATVDPLSVTQEQVEANIIRCPDAAQAEKMIELVEATRKEGNSVGGVVGCVARGVPAGWGEPIFDKLEADLSKALLSIPACKGFEVGSGFAGTLMTGLEHHDAFYPEDGKVQTRSNHSGGIQGGISNGMPVLLRAAFKPTATILHEVETVTTEHESTTLKGRGRHDPCVLPRAVPVVEAMVAITLLDHALRQAAYE